MEQFKIRLLESSEGNDRANEKVECYESEYIDVNAERESFYDVDSVIKKVPMLELFDFFT